MPANSSIPFHGAYWVEPETLLAGPYPVVLSPAATDERLRALLAVGIDTVLDLTEAQELPAYAVEIKRLAAQLQRRFYYARLPIRDMTVPTPEHLLHILNTLDSAIADERRVYLHCWGGIGRTGTVVGAWLVRHGLTGDEALDRIITLREGQLDSPQTPEQVRMVRTWPEGGNLT